MRRIAVARLSKTRLIASTLFVLMCAVVFPTIAHAQATLAGTVHDVSGAVLPGVTVEAASPALIEKVRTAVTDGTGQYRLVDLRPGIYTVTYSLPGFTTVRREGVEISGAQTIAINTEMRVGGVQETITVTGETPVVDIQTVRRQETIAGDVIRSAPIARGYGNVLATVPGIQLSGAGGVSSSSGPAYSFFTANGGRTDEGTIQIAGMNVGSAIGGGGVAAYAYPVAETQEIQVTVSGGLGESDSGGPAMNLIPREGGNSFSGNLYVSTAGDWSQGSNIDDQLRRIGISEPPALVNSWDMSYSMGGPVLRDRIWFYAVARDLGNITKSALGYANLNVGNPNSWTFARDPGLGVRNADSKRQYAVRLTAQVTPRNKVGFYHDYNFTCTGSSLMPNAEGACRPREGDWIALGGSTMAPESATGWDDREKVLQTTYTSPVTNRLLIDGGYSTFISTWGGQVPKGALTDFIPVTEQSSYYGNANFTYRGLNVRQSNEQAPNTWRGAVSYVTGSHSIKFGTQGAYQVSKGFAHSSTNMAYTFNSPCTLNGGVAAGRPCNITNGTIIPTPNQFTISLPNYQSNRTFVHAYYAQDQWTVGRFTFQGALRYEYARSWFPEGENGVPFATRFAGAVSDPYTKGVKGYHDISPRMGVAWDLFGTGKTAVRLNAGHYTQRANNQGEYTANNPASTRQTTAARQWTDRNGNFVVDCNPAVFTAQDVAGGDFCGPVTGAGLNFGSVVRTTTVNPEILEGWGDRAYDWVLNASLQHELIPRLSVELGYTRRWWKNFFYTDNVNLSPANYDRVTITAPTHPSLPGGGGYPVTFRVPNINVAASNYRTAGADYGDETRYYDAFDINANARTQWGLQLQGGTTTGRGVRDTCEIQAALPETTYTGILLNVATRPESCSVNEPWLTTLRGLASYTIPKADVLVSSVFRSQPGTTAAMTPGSAGNSLDANYNVPSSAVFAQLGRHLLAGPTSFQTVNLLLPGELYQKRVNSFDLRLVKILRFAGTRAEIGVDIFNIINANTATTYNQTFGNDGATWLNPTAIQAPRFVRFNATLNF